MFKNIIIFILGLLVISLFYLIMVGSFCRCSPVTCPSDNLLKPHIARSFNYAYSVGC